MSEPTRVLIADDHSITRQGIRLMTENLEDVEVVAEAETGVEAVRLTRELEPDLVLMDLDMPEMDGIEATRRIKREFPDMTVLVLTVHEDDATIVAAIDAGAAGYLPKSSSLDEIRAVFQGLHPPDFYIAPSIAGRLVRSLMGAPRTGVPSPSAAVTVREREILALLGEGYSARRIASSLGISERTVNTHVGNIYRKIGVNNRVDAVREAMRNGLVQMPH